MSDQRVTFIWRGVFSLPASFSCSPTKGNPQWLKANPGPLLPWSPSGKPLPPQRERAQPALGGPSRASGAATGWQSFLVNCAPHPAQEPVLWVFKQTESVLDRGNWFSSFPYYKQCCNKQLCTFISVQITGLLFFFFKIYLALFNNSSI